jgi:Fucose permease
MNLTIISPLLPEISKTFSLNLAKAGSLFTAEFAGFIVFVLTGGFLADKFGKKLIVTVALFGMIGSILLFASSGSFYTSFILMLFVGGFGGIIESMATAMVSDLNEVNRSFYVNLSQVFFGCGAVAGPLLAGLVISKGLSWRFCYYIMVILILIPTIIFIVYKMPALPKFGAVKIKDMGKAFRSKKFIAIFICLAFYTGSEIGGWGWLSTLVKDNMGFSAAKAGISVALFWMAMTVGRFFCGQLTFKFKLRSIIIALAASSSIVTFLAVFAGSEILVWLVIIAMGLTYSSQYALMVDYGTDTSSVSSGITISTLMSGGAVGTMIVPYLMGIIGDNANLRLAMTLPSVLLMLTAIIFAGFGKK